MHQGRAVRSLESQRPQPLRTRRPHEGRGPVSQTPTLVQQYGEVEEPAAMQQYSEVEGEAKNDRAAAASIEEDEGEDKQISGYLAEEVKPLEEADVAKQHDDLQVGDTDEDADRSLMLSVWDFGGQHVFRSLLHLFINRCSVFIVCFRLPDLAEEDTTAEALDHVKFWLHAIDW